MSDFFWFSDEQWARIEPLLPTDTRGMARVDDRRVLSGIIHALKNGGRWADCPREVYGPKKTLYNRFVRWAERGVWEDIFAALAGAEDVPDKVFI
ncbi:MAG: transposase, partial [Hyphomonadaceae bacterium BRH_c29]